MSMRLPGKIQDLAFLRYPGYVTLLFVNTIIESRTTKNAKMISLSQYPVYPLNNQDTKYYASHSEKKSYLTLIIERGNNTFPTSSRFSLVLVSRLFRLFARCL